MCHWLFFDTISILEPVSEKLKLQIRYSELGIKLFGLHDWIFSWRLIYSPNSVHIINQRLIHNPNLVRIIN